MSASVPAESPRDLLGVQKTSWLLFAEACANSCQSSRAHATKLKPAAGDDMKAWKPEWPKGSCKVRGGDSRPGQTSAGRGATTHELPRGRRLDAEVLDEPAVPTRRLVEHVHERRVCLVVHAAAAVREVELAVRDELADERLELGTRVPPTPEELRLDVGKHARRIARKLRRHGVEHGLDIRLLDLLVEAVEVLVDCFEPADIVAASGHELCISAVDWA